MKRLKAATKKFSKYTAKYLILTITLSRKQKSVMPLMLSPLTAFFFLHSAYDNEDTRYILKYLSEGGICTLEQLNELFKVFISDDMKYKDTGFKQHMHKEYEDINELCLRLQEAKSRLQKLQESENQDSLKLQQLQECIQDLQELQEYIQDCLLKCILRYRKKL